MPLPPKRTLFLSLGLSGTGANTGHPESCPDINPIGCATRDVPPEWHDVTLYFAELRLHAGYSFTDWLAVDLMWSLRMVVQRFVLEDLATRQPIAPPFGVDLHHRNETLIGPTDPWLALQTGKQINRWSFRFRLGATLPVGSTVPNPFELAREGKAHEHIQFGTGTVDPFAEVEARYALPHLTLSASLMGKATLYQNGNGYRAGNMLLGGLHAFSELWTKRFSFGLGALLYNEQPERWNGVEEDEGNLGRTDLLVDASVAWKLPGSLTAALSARIPVFTIAAGEQMATPAVIELSIARPIQF
jgi:hypothetical protein